MAIYVSILALNEFTTRTVCLADWLTNLQVVCDNLESLVGNLVSFLLRIVGINNEGARYHGSHVAILATAVDVDGGRLQSARVRVNLEFVQVELAT